MKRTRFWSKNKILVSAAVISVLLIVGVVAAVTSGNHNAQSQRVETTSSTGNKTNPLLSGNSQLPSCTSYKSVDSQGWLEIVKDPDSYSNQCYVIYGEVTQFDAATGTSGFRADVGGVEQTPQYGFVNYPTNTVLVGDAKTLKEVVEHDLFKAKVMVIGSYTYQTQLGGETTVPQLQVNSINVTGSVSD